MEITKYMKVWDTIIKNWNKYIIAVNKLWKLVWIEYPKRYF